MMGEEPDSPPGLLVSEIRVSLSHLSHCCSLGRQGSRGPLLKWALSTSACSVWVVDALRPPWLILTARLAGKSQNSFQEALKPLLAVGLCYSSDRH